MFKNLSIKWKLTALIAHPPAVGEVLNAHAPMPNIFLSHTVPALLYCAL